MEILYKTKKLEKQLTNPKDIKKTFGNSAKRVNQRIKDLKAAETLEVMRSIPAARCHELKGDRQGQLAVNVSNNYRIIFEPYHDPIPQKDDGGLDWTKVVIIKIEEVTDYH